MNRLFEAEVFVRVIEDGSLTAAARRLGMTTSYASKLVTRLEERLGARLLVRTTRKLSLTETGRAYYERCTEAIRGLEEAEQIAADLQQAPRGTLRVTVPNAFGSLYAMGVLAEFKARFPELALELVFLDRQVDLIGEGFDVALRIGELGDARLIARRLASTDRVLLASPRYLERAGTPREPEELAQHECLRYAHHAAPGRWKVQGPRGVVEIDVTGHMVANHGSMLIEAATQGLGLVFLPVLLATAELRAGRLRRVLPAWHWPLGLFAVYPPTPRVPAKTRALVDFLVERMREPPWAGLTG
ncbi:DNA-binding transcriptional regulator, LysR family [Nannocystis exedens]|uniref:DNA-binding transcriptional regulator, LysR family n=1 Tax=Nannocystis exedens TaxID=54 RepID=A0A1I2EPT1_9BACT|nr:LysR family transcriptional regulator [Nannocystis exedens]PCC73920.1 LysR family transcriptional regulator [Nannocystis exedens]SFE94230.1 DNA-binding transcriptional regulator, LysR family [Nannocystis exedens]